METSKTKRRVTKKPQLVRMLKARAEADVAVPIYAWWPDEGRSWITTSRAPRAEVGRSELHGVELTAKEEDWLPSSIRPFLQMRIEHYFKADFRQLAALSPNPVIASEILAAACLNGCLSRRVVATVFAVLQ